MFKNSQGKIRSGWFILIALAAMLLAQLIFTMPGSILLGIVMLGDDPNAFNTDADFMAAMDNYPWLSLLTQGGGTVGGLIVTVLLWRYLNKKDIKEIGFFGSLKNLGFGLLLGAASITAIFIILLVTNNIQMINSFTEPKFSVYTLTFLILFILVGFFEEMFFRGYIMKTMANTGNKKWLIYLVSSLIFSIVHGTNPNVSIFGLVNIFLVGLLFAYMFEVTKSLWMPIGYHITWNYFQGNVFGFAVSGTTPHGIYEIDASTGNNLLTGGAFGLEGGILATLLILTGFIITGTWGQAPRPKA